MVLNITSVINGLKGSLLFDELLDFNAENSKKQDFWFEKPVRVFGEVKNLEGYIHITLTVEAFIQTSCSRCLKPVEVKVSHSLEEMVNEESNEESLMIFKNRYLFDLYETVRTNLLLELPMNNLCSSSCKGLCPSCGKNLNEAACECKTQ